MKKFPTLFFATLLIILSGCSLLQPPVNEPPTDVPSVLETMHDALPPLQDIETDSGMVMTPDGVMMDVSSSSTSSTSSGTMLQGSGSSSLSSSSSQ